MLEQLTNYVYYLPAEATTDRPILGVVRGSRYTLVIDGGNSDAHAHKLQQAMITQFGDAHANFVAVTHHHWDHVFGLNAWDAPVLAEQRVAAQLEHLSTLTWDDTALNTRVNDGTEITFCRDMIQAELPETPQTPRQVTIRLADITFTDTLTLDLGGVCCQIVHVGGEHAPDSCVVYVYEVEAVDVEAVDNTDTIIRDASKPSARQTSVLFLGDCTYQHLYNGHSEASYDMQQLQGLLTRLAKFPAAYYFASHDDTAQDAPSFRQEMEQLTAIGMTVEAHGFDGDLVLEMLSRRYGLRPDDDTRELVRMFQVGLRLRQAKPAPTAATLR